MSKISIRQSGGASIVSLPKAVLKTLGLSVGSRLELSIVDSAIVLKAAKVEETLEELLAASPKERFAITTEDRIWLHDASVGDEC